MAFSPFGIDLTEISVAAEASSEPAACFWQLLLTRLVMVSLQRAAAQAGV